MVNKTTFQAAIQLLFYRTILKESCSGIFFPSANSSQTGTQFEHLLFFGSFSHHTKFSSILIELRTLLHNLSHFVGLEKSIKKKETFRMTKAAEYFSLSFRRKRKPKKGNQLTRSCSILYVYQAPVKVHFGRGGQINIFLNISWYFCMALPKDQFQRINVQDFCWIKSKKQNRKTGISGVFPLPHGMHGGCEPWNSAYSSQAGNDIKPLPSIRNKTGAGAEKLWHDSYQSRVALGAPCYFSVTWEDVQLEKVAKEKKQLQEKSLKTQQHDVTPTFGFEAFQFHSPLVNILLFPFQF